MKERIEAVARSMVMGIIHGGARDLSNEAMDGVILGAVRLVGRIDELWDAAMREGSGVTVTVGQFRAAVEDALLQQTGPSEGLAEVPVATAGAGQGVGDGI